MKRFIPTLLAIVCFLFPGTLSAQVTYEFNNKGADVYVQAGGLIYVQGEVVNDNQGAIVGRMYNSGDIQLTGNWFNQSGGNVFQANDPGTVTFLGNNALQTIGGVTPTAFNNLTINKPGGTREVRQLINSGNDQVLALNDDFLNTGVFAFGVGNTGMNSITRTGGNAPNYMHSTVQGYVTSTVGSAGRLSRATLPGTRYFYPVGTAARWRPVEITPGAGGLNAYHVQFVDAPTLNTTLRAPTLATINPAWYHFLERALPLGSPETIRIYHDFGPDNICDINNVTMSEWNTALWDDLSPTTSNNPAPFMSWTQKAGYPGVYPTPWVTNQFALAGLYIAPSISSCVFPVELLYLTATPKTSSILLNWETATELNNRGFEIQRSTNGIDFLAAGWVNGSGTTSDPVAYEFDDLNVTINQRYFYRLRQVDFNGGEYLSNTVEAMLMKGQDYMLGGFFPNPSNGMTNLWMSVASDVSFNLEVVNMLGQVVHTESRLVGSGYSKLDFDFSRLAKGSYIAQMRLGSDQIQKKLVIE